jgi:hypothetical protein
MAGNMQRAKRLPYFGSFPLTVHLCFYAARILALRKISWPNILA